MHKVNADLLRKYRGICRDIAIKREQMAEARIVTDSVRGSDPEFPYCEHTVVIKGQDVARERRLRKHLRRLEAEKAAVESYIDTIPDPTVRVILTQRYLQGGTWVSAAMKAGLGSESAARMRVERYLKNIL